MSVASGAQAIGKTVSKMPWRLLLGVGVLSLLMGMALGAVSVYLCLRPPPITTPEPEADVPLYMDTEGEDKSGWTGALGVLGLSVLALVVLVGVVVLPVVASQKCRASTDIASVQHEHEYRYEPVPAESDEGSDKNKLERLFDKYNGGW